MTNLQQFYVNNLKLFKVIAKKLVFNQQDREDVLQEVYIKLGSVTKEVAEPKQYLMQTVRNCCYNYRRDKAKTFYNRIIEFEATEDNENATDLFIDTKTPESCLMQYGPDQEVQWMLNLLTSGERQVISYQLQDLNYKDIAYKLGKDYNTIKTLSYLGIKKMQAYQESLK